MIIHEIFIQGIKGLARQVSATPVSHASGMDLFASPALLDVGVEPQSAYECLRSLIYPAHPSDLAEDLVLNGKNPQLGIRFSLQGKNFRCIRTGTGDAIIMQMEQEREGQLIWDSVATGALQIENILKGKLHCASSDFFTALTGWCDPKCFFQHSDAEEAIEEAIDNDLSINSLMIMYENAYTYEQAEARVGQLSQELQQRGADISAERLRRIDPQLEINARQKAALESAINEKLVEIGQLGLGDISQTEFEEVQDAEIKADSLERELVRLHEQKQHLERSLCSSEVRPWPSNPVLWVCLILGLACFVASFFVSPLVVFASFLFIGISFYILVASARTISAQAETFRQIERLEARIDKESDVFAAARQKVQHFKLTVNAATVAQSAPRFAERQKLVNQLAARQVELQQFLDEVGKDGLPVEESPVQQRNPNATLIGELALARDRLEGVEKPAYSAKALAKKMAQHGIVPKQLPTTEPEVNALREQESNLINHAFELGFFNGVTIFPALEELWNEILHRFMHKSLHFCINGRSIEISKEKSSKPSSPGWKEERPNVFRWVLFSFACALVEYAARTERYPSVPRTMFCLHPDALERKDDRRRLERIISGTELTQWFLFKNE